MANQYDSTDDDDTVSGADADAETETGTSELSDSEDAGGGGATFPGRISKSTGEVLGTARAAVANPGATFPSHADADTWTTLPSDSDADARAPFLSDAEEKLRLQRAWAAREKASKENPRRPSQAVRSEEEEEEEKSHSQQHHGHHHREPETTTEDLQQDLLRLKRAASSQHNIDVSNDPVSWTRTKHHRWLFLLLAIVVLTASVLLPASSYLPCLHAAKPGSSSRKQPCHHITSLPAVPPFPPLDLSDLGSNSSSSSIPTPRGLPIIRQGMDRVTRQCHNQIADFNHHAVAPPFATDTTTTTTTESAGNHYHHLYPDRMRGVEARFHHLAETLAVLADVLRALQQGGVEEFERRVARDGDGDKVVGEVGHVLARGIARLEDAARKAKEAGEMWRGEAEVVWAGNVAVVGNSGEVKICDVVLLPSSSSSSSGMMTLVR